MTDPQPSCSGKPWEDKDGATDTDGFLKAFAENDNTFWLMESGHAKNIIEELIERLEAKQKTIEDLREAVLEAHPDGKVFKAGHIKEFDFVEAIKWLGKEWGASMMHQCEPQEIIFTDNDGEERELEYVVGDGYEYNSPSGYCAKEPHPKMEKLEATITSLRAEVAVLKSANVLSHANDYLRNENSRLKAEVERLKKAETDLDAQLAVQANEPTTKTDGYMAGLLNGMLLAKANFGHEYHPISYKDAQLSRLRSALRTLLEGHFNLYKMAFGEQSDPDDDCVRRDAKQALSNTWEEGE